MQDLNKTRSTDPTQERCAINIMQTIRLPTGNMSEIIQIIQIIQIRNLSALKDLDLEVGIDHTDHLSEVCYRFPIARWVSLGPPKG